MIFSVLLYPEYPLDTDQQFAEFFQKGAPLGLTYYELDTIEKKTILTPEMAVQYVKSDGRKSLLVSIENTYFILRFESQYSFGSFIVENIHTDNKQHDLVFFTKLILSLVDDYIIMDMQGTLTELRQFP